MHLIFKDYIMATALNQKAKETYLSKAAEKELLDRLSRIEGHIRGIKQMVHGHKCCDDLLIQIAAIKAAVTQVAVRLLEDHLKTCVTTCMEGGEEEIYDRLARAISVVLKQS